MAFRSGIAGQLGIAQDKKWGEAAAEPKHWYEIESESLALTHNYIEIPLIAGGVASLTESGHQTVSSIVNGEISMPLFGVGGMGMLINQLHGESVEVKKIEAGKAWEQLKHKIGSTEPYGKSLTIEVGRPEPGEGKVKKWVYDGCKISALSVACATSDVAKVSATIIGRAEKFEGEAKSPTFKTAKPFTFRQVELKVGGTKVSGVSDATVNFAIPQPERYRLGNEGMTEEPIINALFEVSVSCTGDFSPSSYERFSKEELKEVQLIATGANIDEGKNPAKFEVKIPVAKQVTSSPSLAGFDIVQEPIEFKALKNSAKELAEVFIVSEDQEL